MSASPNFHNFKEQFVKSIFDWIESQDYSDGSLLANNASMRIGIRL